jgi:transcriptional regulator with XRE-family HTH domain
VSDNELGVLLRSRREALDPAVLGLPVGPRRRTPGLRRSEVASLAGVSVEYLIRLEQGRDRRPSPQILAALADALRLTAAERTHLLILTKAADGAFRCRAAAAAARSVRGAARALLERFEPTPVVLLNRLGEILAHTGAYERLAGPTGLLDHEDGEPPSLPRFVFTDPRARTVFPDWAHVADEQVAALKQGPFRADGAMAALADELCVTAGEPFTRRVATLPGLPLAHGVLRMLHPEAGELRLAYETLDLPADDDQRLVVHLPADAAASAALDRLAGRRPGALHAVPA